MFNGLSAADLLIILASILVSMAFHEAMHGFMAHWLGDTTAQEEGRLTLNPLKHIDLYTTVLLPIFLILLHVPPFFAAKPVPFNPYRVKYREFGVALVGLAGPFTNLVLAVAAALIMRFSVQVGTELFNVLSIFIQVNLGFFVFNMIPFPPLDGSRLLYAFAPEGMQRIMMRIESLNFMAILLFMVVLFPIISPIVTTIIEKMYIFLLG
ncbi:MAG TPA: site-2 protease family protein [Candidatus Saccharimonadales bacterium]|nr:site-2 protease family protein [Candidatus Saccharimonadales bacterium]